MERERDREREFERYATHHQSAASIPLHHLHHAHHSKLPPLEVPAHPHSPHSPTSALASSTSKLTVNSLLSARPSPPPSHMQHPHGLPPPPQSHHPHHHTLPHHPSSHSHYPLTNSSAHPPPTPKQTYYTSDATTKLSSYIRRRCFNCHTPDSAAWRRSSMHPGKVLCNKCGLYERTHQKDRPHDPAELRSKPRKTNAGASPNTAPASALGNSLLATNPNPSLNLSLNPVHHQQQKLSGPGVVGIAVDPVAASSRPLNHGPLLNIHGGGSASSSSAASPIITNSPADRNAPSAHSLGALLNHNSNNPGSHSPGHNSNTSMRLPSASPASKSAHLSPSGYPSPAQLPNSPHLSPTTRDNGQRDREHDSSYPSPRSNYNSIHPYSPREPYHGDIRRSPADERERVERERERERERREDRERRENEDVRESSR